MITFSSDADDKDKVCVEGMGMPYFNRLEPELEQFVNKNGPLVGGVTFTDFVRSNTFCVLVELPPDNVESRFSLEHLPPSFDYPYGAVHTFDPERSAVFMARNPRNIAYNVAHRYRQLSNRVSVQD